MDIIISAATHRSGSTLLQRIFNIRKKTLIWGEQGELLNNFHKIYRDLTHYSVAFKRQRINYFKNGENPNHWIACMVPEMKYVDQAITNSIKVLYDSLYEQEREHHDFVGFKEVRYGENELKWFRKCYPNAKIVLLVRNPLNVWKSMRGMPMLGRDITGFTKKWTNHASYYLKLSEADPNAVLIKYENLVNKEPEAIRTIAELARISPEEINTVLTRKISSTPRVITDEHKAFILQECGEVMKQYGYI